MKINGQSYRTIWLDEDGWSVNIIDQTILPHRFKIENLKTTEDAASAIRDMHVRGAPLIGATAAYGICLALRADTSNAHLDGATERLFATRPTAVNLGWALDEMNRLLRPLPGSERLAAAYAKAAQIADEDVETCRMIGVFGLKLIRAMAKNKNNARVNILTHCNAGWLATVDWGTALSPIYHAFNEGLDVHVWVDETRPRNQGSSLTAYELGAHGVPHTIIVDNAGGHLMQRGEVDLCIVGTDRTAANGDVANKIGTYLKALAAYDNNIPFYVALPHNSVDWTIEDGLRDIPIEERDPVEVTRITGRITDRTTGLTTDRASELIGDNKTCGAPDEQLMSVDIASSNSPARNPAFDVTPARLVSGLITERGICDASHAGLLRLYPERG